MINAIILANKQEEAMKSATPVYLHDLLDQPMLEYITEALEGLKQTLVVETETADKFDKYKSDLEITTCDSDQQLTTFFAELPKNDNTIVCKGNTPMLEKVQIQELQDAFQNSSEKAMVLTINGEASGVCIIDNALLENNATSLEDLLEDAQIFDCKSENDFFPITNRYELSIAENNIRKKIIKQHFFNGVSIKNMDSVTIGPKVEIGQETLIFPNTYITGQVKIGEGCKLGPFLRIRQSATLDNGVKIGNFVELKNAKLGKKSASAHLSYLGDCTIGDEVNIGCGVITVNYDGAEKHHTTIEDDAFIGCNANLVAPVTIGKSSLVAAGSTITKDVPGENLSFARARQVNKAGYQRKRKQKK